MAAVAPTLEDVKEFKTIETIGEFCQDLALADIIADSESGRNISSKSDVGELLDVHVDYDSKKDGGLSLSNIFLNRIENLQTANALLLSIEHRKTSDLFLRKLLIVSMTAQEAMLAETPVWQAN